MISWPPSPIVEDEATALAREQGSDTIAAIVAEEQSIPSRGSPDQMPVIVDSEAENDTKPTEATSGPQPAIAAKRAEQPCTSAPFRDDMGLPTPPSSDNETRGRPQASNVRDQAIYNSRSKSVADQSGPNHVRPTINRIQTDVSGDLERIKAGTRRAPSPYSYSRDTGTFKIDSSRYSTETYLSPEHATNSPLTMKHVTEPDRPTIDPEAHHSSSDIERRSKRSIRFAESHQGPAPVEAERLPRSGVPLPSENDEIDQSQASRSNRRTTEASYEPGNNAPRKAYRSRSRNARSSSKARETSYSSSAEETVVSERLRNTKKTGSDGESVRRRSSHRRERPRLEEPLSHHMPSSIKSSSPEDDTTRRVYRIRDSRGPMTPPSITKPQNIDDYFTQAFRENASKHPRYPSRLSGDESAVLSPPTSPPRTPTSERQHRQVYFESPPCSPNRTPSHSRHPSVDETSIREPKAHSSLLSQATSTAAAAVLARKVSPPVSRSTSNTLETTLACSSNALPVKPRSRASSPQRERLQRSDTCAYGELPMTRVTYPTIPQSKRPSTRDGLPKIEVSVPLTMAQPQRNASWTEYDPHYVVQGTQFGGPLHTTSPMTTTLPASQLRTTPQLQRSQSASTPQELVQRTNDFVLPQCPRSQPTQGLRDWSTFRDLPELDICPKCVHVVSFTRFRPYLVRSHEKLYNKSTVCALSRPWIRIAFTQCVKLNKPDLTLVKQANTLPEGARACEGANSDIRMWWKVIDPATERAVPDFFACSACVGSVHQIFPDLPDQFRRDVLNQEKICGLHQGSRHFTALMNHLDQVSEKCRDRGKSSVRYMQPFVDHIRRITRYPECARDALVPNRPWHFMKDLPEFTICEACYSEVVWPQRERPIAREICKTTQIVPQSAFRGLGTVSSNGLGTHPVSCQLYSDRMRRVFNDVVGGRISYETFRAMVKERQAAQYRLTEMNKMYEEDQRMGWDRRADIEKNKLYWRSLE